MALEKGQAERRSLNVTLTVKWHDRKNVFVLVTAHKSIDMTVDKEIVTLGQIIEILKPKC